MEVYLKNNQNGWIFIVSQSQFDRSGTVNGMYTVVTKLDWEEQRTRWIVSQN